MIAAFPDLHIGRRLRRLMRDTAGSFVMTLAIGMPVLMMAIGFAIDFSRAETLQTQLNAIADAAALAAVDPSMIYQSDAVASATARNLFYSQANQLPGMATYFLEPIVSVDGSSQNSAVRKVTVSYTALSNNYFAYYIGIPTLAISGSSTASAARPPNINFYVMADNSPSMLIPADQTGITQLQNTTWVNVKDTNGNYIPCAFACHNRVPASAYDEFVVKSVTLPGQTQPTQLKVWVPDVPYNVNSDTSETINYFLVDDTDNVYDQYGAPMPNMHVCEATDGKLDFSNYQTATFNGPAGYLNFTQFSTTMGISGNTCSNGTISGQWADSYWAVENYGILYPNSGQSKINLRIDAVSDALNQLVPYAYNAEQSYNTTYSIQAMFFNSVISDTSNLTPGLPQGISYISGTPVATMMDMTQVTSASSPAMPRIPVPLWLNPQCITVGTCLDVAGFSGGAATNFQGMLTEMSTFLPVAGDGSSAATPQEVLILITDGFDQDLSGNQGGLSQSELDLCNTIKTTNNVRIAVLYTQYTPSSINQVYPSPSYDRFLEPTDLVAQSLQQCASVGSDGLPLFTTVAPGSSITMALQALFTAAADNAYLSQ